jgi:hypothetical protein
MKEHPNQQLCTQYQTLFDETFVTNETSRKLLDSSSLLLGMHPDQATEPIVDIAIRFQKPFAIVPCCVFHRLFPNRRTNEGNPVIQYADFVEYLKEKDPSIQIDYLNFEGRNKVLYRLP